MKYYLSHVQNCQEHYDQFPVDTAGNKIIPYRLVAERAYIMTVGETIDDGEGGTFITKTRHATDCQSVALICADENFSPFKGQTLYESNQLEIVKLNHPLIDYSTLGQAWVDGVLLP